MSRIELKRGQTFTLHGGPVRIGPSGTVCDTQVEWAGAAAHCGNDPELVGLGIGSLQIGNESFDVILDVDTGRLWYDDERGY